MASSVIDCPYDAVVPYSTWLSEFLSVVQVIVALVAVMPTAATLDITGGVVSGRDVVVKVKSPEVARLPASSLDLTR
ncbi:MAG: hypothetical protein J2P31_00345 [Blastocatellia bacterium]|nr:hypothetical protein [Blastocatellia bacterium]